jgi:hypothetical protein
VETRLMAETQRSCGYLHPDGWDPRGRSLEGSDRNGSGAKPWGVEARFCGS